MFHKPADERQIPERFTSADTPRLAARRIRKSDSDWLVHFDTDPVAQGVHNWSGPKDPEAVRSSITNRIERDGWVSTLDGRLLVELIEPGHHTEGPDSTVIGHLTWRPRFWGPQPESQCFVFGIALLPDYRGRGLGTEAHRLIADLLLDHVGIHRLEADTATTNVAEQRCLERTGFVHEGTIRQAEFVNGAWVDHELFALLRRDYLPDFG